MNIAIIGEFDPSFRPHVSTNAAIEHLQSHFSNRIMPKWVSTQEVAIDIEGIIEGFDGFWIAPGSPYKNLAATLQLIEQTRLRNIPTLGTCGGFQHMVIEFARNVLEIKEAAHAEYDPYASQLIINPLSCDLKGDPLTIELIDKDSKAYAFYGQESIIEKYYCNFGLNPFFQEDFDNHGFRIVGTDSLREARIVELSHHPFFIGTLFVPQDQSTFEKPHPLIWAFLKVVGENLPNKGKIS